MPARKQWTWGGAWILVGVLALGGCASSGGVDNGSGQMITATLADVGNQLPGTTTASVVIHIEDYSSPQEVDRLARLLAEKGPDAVREATLHLEKGWIRVGDSLGYPLAVITRHPTAGGEKIAILLDRQLSFAEQWQNLPSADYPFGYIELDLDRNGKGEGQLIPAGQIRLNNGGVEVVQYGLQPARLLNVQVQG